MTGYEVFGLLLTAAAAFAYVNHRWVRLQPAVAMMAMSLATSLAVLAVDAVGVYPVARLATTGLDRLAFDQTLLHGVLGALLFAGALHVDLGDLREQRLPITVLAFAGTLVSTFVVGGLAVAIFPLLGVPLSLGECFLFGALISPTDPIAVLGILHQARVPKALEIQIAGESLFNDGIGVVVFLTILAAVTTGGATVGSTMALFAREALGGAVFGAVSGYAAYRLLRSIDHYQTELLITLALVLGGYALAERLHISAPIAAVVSGLLIGNQGRTLAMSDTTRDHLDKFWALVDAVLNALLFVVIGLEMLRLRLSPAVLVAGVAAIVIVLTARLVSVALPVALLGRWTSVPRGAVPLLTLGGLRGGISVALALSLPRGPARDAIVVVTYVVVVASILVQAPLLGPIARRLGRSDEPPP